MRFAKWILCESEENNFIDAIFDYLPDISPLMMYADWLMERGDPRGEYIITFFKDGIEARKRQTQLRQKLWRLRSRYSTVNEASGCVLVVADEYSYRYFPKPVTIRHYNDEDQEVQKMVGGKSWYKAKEWAGTESGIGAPVKDSEVPQWVKKDALFTLLGLGGNVSYLSRSIWRRVVGG